MNSRELQTYLPKTSLSIVFALLLLLDWSQIPPAGAEMLCNCVAFRLDDVQDYFLNDVQIGIIEKFANNNASLTIGIIGNYFGQDQKLVSFLNERLSNNSDYSTLEVANHGWNHEDFTVYDKNEQAELMSKTNQKIFEVLGINPSVFIAPFNKISNVTFEASRENEIWYISANTTTYPLIAKASNEYVQIELGGTEVHHFVYHFPSTAITGDLNDDDTEWYGATHVKTLEDVEKSIQTYGYAIVTLHPQEYATRDALNFQNEINKEQMHELGLVLKGVSDKGLRIVTISEISNYSVIPEFKDLVFYAVFIASLAIAVSSKQVMALLKAKKVLL